jgi:dienelactone hydrolase
MRYVTRQPVVRVALTAPRTAGFVMQAWARGRRIPTYPELPAPRVTPALAAQVAIDEAIIALMRSPKRYPHRADYLRVAGELREARALYDARGWLTDPRSYHDDPPPLREVDITLGRARGIDYERVAFASGYEPHPDEPGRDRWLSLTENRTAYAYVVRHHDSTPRPWVVCVHGFGTGTPMLDIPGFRVAQLHHDLGLNVLLPVLALHGPRRVGRWSGEALMTFDLLQVVFGMAQSVWDIRRLLNWAGHEGATRVGAYGLSLGGYTVALLAGVADGLAGVIAGIPCTDFPALFRHHAPPAVRQRASHQGLLGEDAHVVHRVISPLALAPRVPYDGRFVFAGLGDRMATPWQAHRLWQHWERPAVLWYEGNHVAFFWSAQVGAFVRDALTATLLDPDGTPERASGDRARPA